MNSSQSWACKPSHAMGKLIAARSDTAAEIIGLAVLSAGGTAHLMMSSDSYIETPVLSSTCGPHAFDQDTRGVQVAPQTCCCQPVLCAGATRGT